MSPEAQSGAAGVPMGAGAAGVPVGAGARQRLLGNAADAGERAPLAVRRHRSSFPSSFPETETTTATHSPAPFYPAPA